MPAARRIGVGELVHKNDLGMPRDDGIEVHLLEPLPLVFEATSGNNLKAFQQSLGFLAAVGFHRADRHVVAVELTGAGLLQHLVGLAYPRCGPDENLEPASRALFAPGCFEQGLGGRSLVRVAALIRHQDSFTGCRTIERQIERKHVTGARPECRRCGPRRTHRRAGARYLRIYCALSQRAAPEKGRLRERCAGRDRCWTWSRGQWEPQRRGFPVPACPCLPGYAR